MKNNLFKQMKYSGVEELEEVESDGGVLLQQVFMVDEEKMWQKEQDIKEEKRMEEEAARGE